MNTKSIEDFFPRNHLNLWTQTTLNQLQSMSSASTYFDKFIGDRNRFQKAANNYSRLIPEILKVIDKKAINQTEKLIQKFLSIIRPEIFNPKSVIKLEDIIKE